MVVMLIIAVLAVAGTVALGSIRGADADTTANVLAGAMRYVATLSVQHNKTHRLVIDMEGKQWWVEVANDDDPCGRFVPDDADPKTDALAVDESGEVAARGAAGDGEDGEVALPTGGFAATDDMLLKGEFEAETTVSAVLTEHHLEPQAEGKVAIYFYPNGYAERAFVWVAEERERDGEVVAEPEITLRLESLGQVVRVTEVLSEDDFRRSDTEERL
ncbi:MAG: hypothetical protein IT385_03295 [Deltaproteobacteria bacterium]|nr:hypothetical protein [Deltaproteobacteria bacterium]